MEFLGLSILFYAVLDNDAYLYFRVHGVLRLQKQINDWMMNHKRWICMNYKVLAFFDL